MLKEFKEFIARGNVIDMAVGIVMGGAFGAIVNSLVNDIVMPLVGYLTAGVDFTSLKAVIQPAVVDGGEVVTEEIAIRYGMLIQTIINFLIIALCIFLMVKGVNELRKATEAKEEEATEEAPAKSEEVLLLEEIRDSLKKD